MGEREWKSAIHHVTSTLVTVIAFVELGQTIPTPSGLVCLHNERHLHACLRASVEIRAGRALSSFKVLSLCVIISEQIFSSFPAAGLHRRVELNVSASINNWHTRCKKHNQRPWWWRRV